MKRYALTLLILTFALSPARAQFVDLSVQAAREGYNPAGISGTHALFINPAGLRQAPGFHLSLLDGNAFTGGNLLRFDLYNRYLTSGTSLASSEADALLQSWFGDAVALRTLSTGSQFIPLALSYASDTYALGVAIRMRQHGRLSINRGLLDILLKGTGDARTVPLNGTYHAASYTEITLGYARSFLGGRLDVGLAPRFLLGAQATEASLTSTVEIGSGILRHTYTYELRAAGALNDLLQGFNLFDNPELNTQASQAFARQLAGLGTTGTGMGLSLGARYRIRPRWSLGISLTDIGFIRWSSNARTYIPTGSSFVFEGITLDLQRLRDEYDGDLGAYVSDAIDSLARAAYEDVEKRETTFSTSLPTAVHVGLTYTHGAHSGLGLAMSMGLNDAPGNLSRTPLLTLSAHTRVFVFPLFGGLQVGGNTALTLYGGTGLKIGSFSMLVGLSGTPRSALMGTGSRFGLMVSLLALNP